MTVTEEFEQLLTIFVASLQDRITTKDGQWSVKGFIDVFQNVYTISSDTKIISKLLEIHLFPYILEFASNNGYKVVLAEHQNHYPDVSFVKKLNLFSKFKFVKTSSIAFCTFGNISFETFTEFESSVLSLGFS